GAPSRRRRKRVSGVAPGAELLARGRAGPVPSPRGGRNDVLDLGRAPRSGFVVREVEGWGRAPGLDERVDPPPGAVHPIAPGEEGLVPLHRVVEERGVRAEQTRLLEDVRE